MEKITNILPQVGAKRKQEMNSTLGYGESPREVERNGGII